MKLGAWLRGAGKTLCAGGAVAGQGTLDLAQEARWMAARTLNISFDALDPRRELTSAEATRLNRLLERRLQSRQPLAYLLGEAWLRGQRFYCGTGSLIPRSPIAELLTPAAPGGRDDRLGDWFDVDHVQQVLDLCTGGASLAILAAYRWPAAKLVGSDCSAAALTIARRNLRLHRLGRRIELVHGDLFAGLAGRRFDLILCNPPYVTTSSMRKLPPEYRAEPALALAGGRDGLALVRKIIARAPRHLNPNGALIIEIGHGADQFEASFARLEFAWLPVAAGERMIACAGAAALARYAARVPR